MSSRRQLTLFVDQSERAHIETLRNQLDPIQAALIAAHVTLCREDEIASLDGDILTARLYSWKLGALKLGFGAPHRFEGHGVMLPCVRGQDEFQQLRHCILAKDAIRWHVPHLTLAHPRNPQAPGNTNAALCNHPKSTLIHFPVVSLIEQHEQRAWRVLHEIKLHADASMAQ